MAECDVLLVTINAADTQSFCDKYLEMIPDSRRVVVFSLQRGVKNSSILKERYK
jgi:hypothetical protein